MMQAVWQELTSAVFATGVGKGIDLYIGRSGQQKVRDWLELNWYRVAEIRRDELAAREARFALRIMSLLCGRRFFSIQRVTVSVAVVAVAAALGGLPIARTDFWSGHAVRDYLGLIGGFAAFVTLNQLVIRLSLFWAGRTPEGAARSVLRDLRIAAWQIFLLVWLVPSLVLVVGLAAGAVAKGLRTPDALVLGLVCLAIAPFLDIKVVGMLLARHTGAEIATAVYLGAFYGLRLLSLALFVALQLSRLLRRPVLRFWAHLVEQGDPVFAVLFGLLGTATGLMIIMCRLVAGGSY